MRQRNAIHCPRHANIGENDMNAVSFVLQDLNRLIRGRRFQDGKISVFEGIYG